MQSVSDGFPAEMGSVLQLKQARRFRGNVNQICSIYRWAGGGLAWSSEAIGLIEQTDCERRFAPGSPPLATS